MRFLILTTFLSIITFVLHAQKYGDYNPGCIYDLQNVRSVGLIKWTPPSINVFASAGDHIFFKLTEDDQRLKVKSTQFRSFTMGADSFVVSHAKETEQYPIFKVVFNKTVKLYARYRITNYYMPGTFVVNRYMINYYFGPDPDHITELNRQNFIEVMTALMDDRADLVTMVKNKKYRYGDMDELLKAYFIPSIK